MAHIAIVNMRRLDFIDDNKARHEFRSDAINRHFIEDRHLDDPFIKAFIASGNVVVLKDDPLVPDAPAPLPDGPPEQPEILPDGPPNTKVWSHGYDSELPSKSKKKGK